MGNRRHIPKEQKDLVVQMSVHLKPRSIARVTGISPSAIRRIVRLWQKEGVTVRTPLQCGRPRQLSSLDLVVSSQPIIRGKTVLTDI